MGYGWEIPINRYIYGESDSLKLPFLVIKKGLHIPTIDKQVTGGYALNWLSIRFKVSKIYDPTLTPEE